MKTPQQIANDVRGLIPEYPKHVTEYYLTKPDFTKEYWPDYCFIPMNYWAGLAYKKVDRAKANSVDVYKFFVHYMAVIGTWAYCKSIYKFNDYLFEELKHCSLSENIPVEVIKKLPEYSIYIETPNCKFNEMPMAGFFVMIEHVVEKGEVEDWLTVVINTIDERIYALPLLLIKENETFHPQMFGQRDIEGTSTPINKENIRKDADFLLSLILYICSENNKYSELASVTPSVIQVKTKHGLKLFQPPQVKIKTMGEKEGAAIKRFREQENEYTTGTKKRPHMRRAHWHGYWVGKLGSDSREFKYNWLPPTFINNTEEAETT